MYIIDALATHTELTVTRLCLILKYGIHIMSILIPLLLMYKCIMDWFKSVMNPKEITNSLKMNGYRLICALTIFFIPTFANAIFGMIEEYNPDAYTTIYQNASPEKVELLEVAYENEIAAQRAKDNAEVKEASLRQAEEARKKIEQMEEQKNRMLDYAYQSYSFKDNGSRMKVTVDFYDNTTIVIAKAINVIP